MAAYDYLCRTCEQVVEVRASIAQKAAGITPQCPSCKGEDLRRVFTTVGIASGSAVAPAGGGGGGCCGGSCGCG